MRLQILRSTTGQGVVFEAKISEHLGGQDVVGQQTQCIARGSNRGHGVGVEVEFVNRDDEPKNTTFWCFFIQVHLALLAENTREVTI